MWRTAATTRKRSSCSAEVNPTVSSAFCHSHVNDCGTTYCKQLHLEQVPFLSIVDTVDFSPALVEILVILNIAVQQQGLCDTVSYTARSYLEMLYLSSCRPPP